MRVAGLDEVGRGALAGPLVAAGVVLKFSIKGLNDSKKLNRAKRERLHEMIASSGAEIVVEQISVRQINSRGMGWANREIFKKIIKKIKADKYIVDGNLKIKVRNKMIKSVIKADNSRKCVMAAAIVAKVTRDAHMVVLHEEEPKYGWKINKGYGTKSHIQALREHGVSKHHRNVFVTTALRKTRFPGDRI